MNSLFSNMKQYSLLPHVQLSSDVSESELVDAFRAFGTVLDRTVMRNTKCAYIDFEDAESATQARRAMNGAFLGGTALRVEFKVTISSVQFQLCCVLLSCPW